MGTLLFGISLVLVYSKVVKFAVHAKESMENHALEPSS
jgi:hypothetical protein